MRGRSAAGRALDGAAAGEPRDDDHPLLALGVLLQGELGAAGRLALLLHQAGEALFLGAPGPEPLEHHPQQGLLGHLLAAQLGGPLEEALQPDPPLPEAEPPGARGLHSYFRVDVVHCVCAYVVLCTVLYLEVRSSSDLDLTQTIACTDVVSNSLGENTSSIARPGLCWQHEVGYAMLWWWCCWWCGGAEA